MVYSRRRSLEEKKNRKSAMSFIVLTIILVVALFYFGIPLIVRYTGFLTDLRKSSEPVEVDDATPPPIPRLDPLPEATKDKSVDINGSTEPGATVIIEVNSNPHEILANKSGRFSYTFDLVGGENTISAVAKDISGNESGESEKIVVVYDLDAPDLEIISPKDGQEFYGNSQKQISIEGATDKDASITINDRFVLVDNEGKFKFSTNLSEGENVFTIKAEDKASNVTESKLILKYSP